MRTYIELFSITPSNDFTFITELIEEEKSPKSVNPNELREGYKRKCGNATERQLDKAIRRPRMAIVTVATGEVKMGEDRDDDREDYED